MKKPQNIFSRLFTPLLLVGLLPLTVQAQPAAAEAFTGVRSYKYQHLFVRPLEADSRFGFMNISSVQQFYQGPHGTEIMSQSYLTYALTPAVKLAAGQFYATGAGFRPTVALQLAGKTGDLLYLLFSRGDVRGTPSAELVTVLEYRPLIKRGLRFYSRLHAMANYGPRHNRSFQYLVAGVDWRKTQVALGWSTDAWGSAFEVAHNFGVLLRKELF